MSKNPSAGPSRRHPMPRSDERFPLAAMAATLAVIALFVVLALLAARADAATRTLTGAYEPRSAHVLELDIPFGDVRIRGVEGGSVRVRVEAECTGDSRCDEFLEGLRLESRNRGGALQVKLESGESFAALDGEDHGSRRHGSGHRDSGFTVTVEMPRSLALELDFGAGELSIEDLRDDVTVDMGAGEIDVRMPERSVHSVEVNLAVGETAIHQGGRTREYTNVLGGPVRWTSGRGDSEIEVNLGAGEVEVTLE